MSSIASMLSLVLVSPARSGRADPQRRPHCGPGCGFIALVDHAVSRSAWCSGLWRWPRRSNCDRSCVRCSVRSARFRLRSLALAALGTLWSDAPWGARIYALSPATKLLVLPFLFYHFERSPRGMWVFVAFLASCTLLMADVLDRRVRSRPFAEALLTSPAAAASSSRTTSTRARNSRCARWRWRIRSSRCCATKRIWLALLLSAIALGFVVNMAFVIVSRTALVTMPIMLAVFALLHLKWRTSV